MSLSVTSLLVAGSLIKSSSHFRIRICESNSEVAAFWLLRVSAGAQKLQMQVAGLGPREGVLV